MVRFFHPFRIFRRRFAGQPIAAPYYIRFKWEYKKKIFFFRFGNPDSLIFL